MKAIVSRMVNGKPGLGSTHASVVRNYRSVKTLTRYYLDRFKRDGETYQVEVYYGDSIYGSPDLTLLYTDGFLRRLS